MWLYKTRDLSTRLSRSKHIFLRENPELRKLFRKLEQKNIHTLDDIKDIKLKRQIRKIMIETEVEWCFNLGNIPYLTFSNHTPYQGRFEEAIPKIIKKLEKV